jgi:hypothetical protein
MKMNRSVTSIPKSNTQTTQTVVATFEAHLCHLCPDSPKKHYLSKQESWFIGIKVGLTYTNPEQSPVAKSKIFFPTFF